jgi:hypothetical protein
MKTSTERMIAKKDGPIGWRVRAMSVVGPGCVKTHASEGCGKFFFQDVRSTPASRRRQAARLHPLSARSGRSV